MYLETCLSLIHVHTCTYMYIHTDSTIDKQVIIIITIFTLLVHVYTVHVINIHNNYSHV